MSKKLLIVRTILFVLFGCLIPFGFIAFRYGIFKAPSNLTFSGIGVFAIIIVIAFALYIANAIKRAMPFSIVSQIITGLLYVIVPLVCFYCLLNAIRSTIDIFLNCLIVTIISESIAIIVNPIPQLLANSQIEKQESLFTRFATIMKGDK